MRRTSILFTLSFACWLGAITISAADCFWLQRAEPTFRDWFGIALAFVFLLGAVVSSVYE